MEIPNNITFSGTNATELEAAFQYVWDNSPSFRDKYNLGRQYIVSYDDILGIGGREPAYHKVEDDGIGYVRVNPDRIATLVIGGVPESWVGYGYVYDSAEFRNEITDRGYVVAEDFPSSEMFWENQIGNTLDRTEWSGLPDVDDDPRYTEYAKWVYVKSGAQAAGIPFDENFVFSDFAFNWENSPEAIDALVAMRDSSLVSREMTLEERIAHEFTHGMIEGSHQGFVDGSNELSIIEFMNSVRADLGLPPLRDPVNGLGPEDIFVNLASAGYSIATVKMVLEQLGLDCFSAGTEIMLADDATKPIEQIVAGDLVVSYDGDGQIVYRRVLRTFTKEVSHLLDVHGLKVTPGHVTLCGDGRFCGRHIPIIDILLSDGALVREDGELVRMSINQLVGSIHDQMVKVLYTETSEDAQAGNLEQGSMRVGTLLFDRDGEPVSVLDCINAQGMVFHAKTGLISTRGGAPEPLSWFGKLPRPEDYILKRSKETLEGILTDDEWDGPRSELIQARLLKTANQNFC